MFHLWRTTVTSVSACSGSLRYRCWIKVMVSHRELQAADGHVAAMAET